MTVFITEGGVVDVPFTPAVEALYGVLASEQRFFSQAELFNRLWGFDGHFRSNAVCQRVKQARRAMAQHGIHGKIVTRNGSGYMLGQGVSSAG